ncbi:MAG: AAA-like domain-containing protein [Gammaproteobacteria bacterium]
MPKVAQGGDFFVVGGPVQPDRPCYVERSADAELARGIAEQRFCYVLAARSTGKTSLIARAIRDLRRAGQLAAVVDLSQIGVSGERGDAARWYYGIAYRVLRELRLKVDLQGWWQEKSALTGELRLAEFFADVVLAHTSVPVTVFIDEIERTLSLPFARELFATIHACYARRVSEPEYARLNFVVLGVAAPDVLCSDPVVSPFIDGLAIEPKDFTLEQSMKLAAGFGADADDRRELMTRIHAWSGGQPYLTQRIARAVARKGGRLDDVDRVVRELFLAPGAAEKDPYLNRIRHKLAQRGGAQRQALVLLGKIARGMPVPDDPSSPGRELLRLAGVTVTGNDGRLHYRNRILRAVFDDGWIASVRPFDWRGAAAVAALIALAVAVPLWYSQILPRPYIRTLSVVTQDYAVAEDAYEKLRRLPGFAGMADRLLAEAMARRSREASSYAEMLAADQVLREVLEQAPLADELQAEYWLRRASVAMHEERRDEALVMTTRAAVAGDGEAKRLAAELVGDDYPRLVGTYRFAEAPAAWAVDFDAGELAVVDKANRAQRVPTRGHGPLAAPSVRLTSMQHVPVQREIGVAEGGDAEGLRLRVNVRHDRPDDLLFSLIAPSGSEARFGLDGPIAPDGRYELAADEGPLAALAGERRAGAWRLAVVDRRSGAAGTLIDWSLSFAGSERAWRDAPERGLAIPDPVSTGQVDVVLGGNGRIAAVFPSRVGVVGALSIWDLADGRLLHRLDLDGRPDLVAFDADGSRLIVQVGDVVSLWNVESGERIGEIEAETALLLRPALSVDGRFLAVVDERANDPPRLRLVRTHDGAVIAQADAARSVTDWVVGPDARYAATIGPEPRVVTVQDPRLGKTIRELKHERDVRRLIAAPAGDLLLSVDDLGDVRAWRVRGAASRGDESFRIGTTVDAESVSVSADGALVAFAARRGEVIVRAIAGDAEPIVLRPGPTATPAATALAPDGSALVTAADGRFRLWRVDLEPSAAPPDANLSALALDTSGGIVALGYREGHVRVRSASEVGRPEPRRDAIDYIGHRGRVSALAIHAARGLIASGGSNGVVRLWDLATVSPSEHFMRHPAGPVRAIAISPNGRWVASAAEYFARVFRTSDGELAGELTVNGTAQSVAFSHDSSRWAVGDSAGNVFVTIVGDAAPLGSVRAQGPVTAVAFSPDGAVFASGDERGHVELWDASTFSPIGPRHALPHAVRWIAFVGSASELLIQTDAWLHRAVVDRGRTRVVASRLLPAGIAAGGAIFDDQGLRVRLVEGLAGGSLALHDVPLDAPAVPPLPDVSPLLTRDWSAALGLVIGADGELAEVLR